MRLELFVAGEPKPQGSMIAFKTKSGKVLMRHSNNKMGEWRLRIASEVQQIYKEPPVTDPIEITINFFLKRPKRKNAIMPTTRPDLDKLVRAVLDALTGIAFADDSQVLVIKATKVYSDRMGVYLRVETITPYDWQMKYDTKA
jgi:crossover junction endodeoxyribonuclease RusA